MRIFLVRHPPITGKVGVCYGRMDVHVEPSATTSTTDAVIASITPAIVESAMIFSSPLSRCTTLARKLASPREPTISDDLLEISFGSWEGERWDDVPRDQIDAWAKDVWNYRPGAGESAELVARRWRSWVSQIQSDSCQTAIAVTHAGFIRTALACIANSRTTVLLNSPIEFGSVHQIDLKEN